MALTVLSIVGARPQFIKAAVLSPALREVAREVLVDTGQHYDHNMSQVFYDALCVPSPDYQLNIGGGSHGAQTGRMLEAMEAVLIQEHPDWVLVYGDTNTTLAGALAAAKLGIPLAHVEAGLRSYNRGMPEEINRVVTDHVSERLYCPNGQAAANLEAEGIVRGVLCTGDVMDVLVDRTGDDPVVLPRYGVEPGRYFLATVHRAATVDSPTAISGVLQAMGALGAPVLLPLHPRTAQSIERYHLEHLLKSPIHPLPPLGYKQMITLQRHALAVLTDSGGVQREACRLGVPTYILRDETEWGELVASGQAVLTGTDAARILEAVHGAWAVPRAHPPATDPVQRIVQDLMREGDIHA